MILIGLCFSTYSYSQKKAKSIPIIDSLFLSNFSNLQPVSGNPLLYEAEIIYTQIDRTENGTPKLKIHHYNKRGNKFFYPASLVKLPVSMLALQRLNELNLEGLTYKTPMLTDSVQKCDYNFHVDSSNYNFFPTIENHIKKIMLISDNPSYSRLYEFLGTEYINNQLLSLGYKNIEIINKYSSICNAQSHSVLNPITFINYKNDTLMHLPLRIEKRWYNASIKRMPKSNFQKGRKYRNESNRLIKKPKDFTNSNKMDLKDADKMLKQLIFPQLFDSLKQFNLTEKDRNFLLRYMCIFPREAEYPKFKDTLYTDNYKKYWIYGNVQQKIESDSIRIINIVGRSFGFLCDCAYIFNAERGVEFFLCGSIYVNKNNIINDGLYEYKSIGLPFFSEFGKIVYRYEMDRKKNIKPDLTELKRIVSTAD